MALRDPYPTIDPGRFRHLVTFLDQVEVQDVSGTSLAWQPASPPDVAWASVEILSGTDVIKAGLDTARLVATVTTWFRGQRKASQRIQLPDGSRFVIQAIENVQMMGVFARMTCLGLGANEW